MGKLSDVQLRSWVKAGEPLAKSDGDGLTFTLSAKGVASWVLRYRHGGKAKELSLGRYPDLPLVKVRKDAAEMRVAVAKGVDVAGTKRLTKLEAKNARTITQLADDYLKDLVKRGKSDASISWHVSAYIKPKFGKRNIDDVRPREILSYFQDLAEEKPSTARSVFGTLRRMYEFAVARQIVDFSPAATIKPHVIASKAARERNLSADEVGKLLRELSNPDNSLTEAQQIAIRMLLWTLGRKTEVTEMHWSEYDAETGIWTLPEERAKNGRTHLIPLPSQAIAGLKRMKEIGCESTWVFPGKTGEKPMGETTLNERLTRSNRLGIAHWRIHDLRRTGSTMLHEMGFQPHIIERALNHIQDGVGGVYNKAQWLDERALMLQQWADYLDVLESGAKVLPFKARGSQSNTAA
jgi:integrase